MTLRLLDSLKPRKTVDSGVRIERMIMVFLPSEASMVVSEAVNYRINHKNMRDRMAWSIASAKFQWAQAYQRYEVYVLYMVTVSYIIQENILGKQDSSVYLWREWKKVSTKVLYVLIISPKGGEGEEMLSQRNLFSMMQYCNSNTPNRQARAVVGLEVYVVTCYARWISNFEKMYPCCMQPFLLCCAPLGTSEQDFFAESEHLCLNMTLVMLLHDARRDDVSI